MRCGLACCQEFRSSAAESGAVIAAPSLPGYKRLPMEQLQIWLSVPSAARRFRVTSDTMRKWALKGLVPSRQDERGVYVSWTALQAALRQQPRPLGTQIHGE